MANLTETKGTIYVSSKLIKEHFEDFQWFFSLFQNCAKDWTYCTFIDQNDLDYDRFKVESRQGFSEGSIEIPFEGCGHWTYTDNIEHLYLSLIESIQNENNLLYDTDAIQKLYKFINLLHSKESYYINFSIVDYDSANDWLVSGQYELDGTAVDGVIKTELIVHSEFDLELNQ